MNTINLSKNKKYEIEERYFSHSVGGDKIKEETIIELLYDDKFLHIDFKCLDNPFTLQNSYKEDNTDMWNQEVFELFIANGNSTPEKYLEIEINPNNALFLGTIHNFYKTDGSKELNYIDTKTSGIQNEVFIDEEKKMWGGKISLPLNLLKYPTDAVGESFRINFFRVICNEKQDDLMWEGNAENCTYACLNSTMSEQPNFHSPEHFITLKFNN